MKHLDAAEPARRGPSAKFKARAARLMAVQALYQSLYNKQDIEEALREYLLYRTDMEVEGDKIVAPNIEVLTHILRGVAERGPELNDIINHNLNNKTKDIDTLIRALLLCAAWELMARHDLDPPILINDYLEVAHTFFDQGEVGLINGVLDAVAKSVR